MKSISRFWPGWAVIRDVSGKVYDELFRTRAFTIAAAMAFYFILSLVPLLIVISALLGYLPIPRLFQQLLDIMASVVPPDAMAMVRTILRSVLKPNRGGLLSFGVVSYLWSASGGFASTIEALNIAYDVKKERSWWRDRAQALLLTFTTGFASLIGLLFIVAGPHFGHFLAEVFGLPKTFAHVWPVIRTFVILGSAVLSIEMLYYLGPNMKQRFRATLPGAILAVVGFFLSSLLMSVYFEHFSNYNATYGSLGAVIILMLWFYVVSLYILIGAELNAELAKRLQRRVSAENARPEMPQDARPKGAAGAAAARAAS